MPSAQSAPSESQNFPTAPSVQPAPVNNIKISPLTFACRKMEWKVDLHNLHAQFCHGANFIMEKYMLNFSSELVDLKNRFLCN